MTKAPPTRDLQAEAWAAASAVAGAGGFAVREVREPDEHRAVEQLLVAIWETGPATPPMPGDILRMLAYTGAYVAGAYDGPVLIGAAVGFLTDTQPGFGPAHLHSHIAGVAPRQRGRRVGFALKLHQRAWALQRGFDRISWTFDPLVSRNAHFNLSKLAAEVSRYYVDFYGDMPDGLNAGQGSDRILLEWRLDGPAVRDAAAGLSHRAVPDPRAATALRPGPDHAPVLSAVPPGAAFVCQIPPDIEALRRDDPELGRSWRGAVRAALRPAIEAGRRVEFDRRLGYLVHAEPKVVQ